ASCLEGAFDADELRSHRGIALEGLEILDLLAKVPDAAVLGGSIPVIRGLMDQTTLKDQLPEHDTVYTRDPFRLVHDIHRVHLRGAAVLPVLSDLQGKIGIRLRRVLGVVEASRSEIGVIAIFPEHPAGSKPGVMLTLAEQV